jgi:IS5 family transposase
LLISLCLSVNTDFWHNDPFTRTGHLCPGNNLFGADRGKEHKKYEFGSQASVVMTQTAGVIVGAVAHAENLNDGDALRPALAQTKVVTGQQPARAIVDRGYRGRKEVDGTEVLLPGKPKPEQSKSVSAKLRACFRRRAAIEPVISHLKHQYRLARCFLKGFVGDQVNLLLAAAAWNLKKWLRAATLFWLQLIRLLATTPTPLTVSRVS